MSIIERTRKYHFLLLFIPVIVLLGFFVSSIATLIRFSFHISDPIKAYIPGFTFDNYLQFFEDPWYRGVILRNLRLATVVCFFTFLLGYPYAYATWRARGKKKSIFLLFVMFPLFTNLTIRLYGWMILLGRFGPISLALQALNIVDKPVSMVFSFRATAIGLVSECLPYFILTLLPVLEGIDWSIVESARDLGADKLRSFYETVLPLSISGLSAGIILTFIWSLGAFVTPAILGSRSEYTLAVEAEDQIMQLFNWPYGATISIILVTMTLSILLIYYRTAGRRAF